MIKPIPRASSKQLKGKSKFDYLWDIQEGKCFYCDTNMEPPKYNYPGRKTATFDHVTPKSKGGGRSNKNLVLACRDCNGKKGDKTLEEFLGIIP